MLFFLTEMRPEMIAVMKIVKICQIVESAQLILLLPIWI